ncbi:collagenase [Oceanobacillus luteolus]|uniref:collagenase n=1 Tax=Oceanobacillus luteolus TaxID=1274358 RepID=UPI00203B707B|nr:collagenase [Oceanobacillus luteolus]MCM3741302.1 collagenase [Oceanobacillus luteolus]
MRHIYAFESKEDYSKYEDIIMKFSGKLANYQRVLEENFQLVDLPKAVVWTTTDLATSAFSDVPIPAYTNKDCIYFSPDLMSWRNLFLRQLDGKRHEGLEQFFKTMNENHIFSILAHELTHHSDLFLDDFGDAREDGIWFEEGMCDYLSRKFTLNQEEFREISQAEVEIVDLFKENYGGHSLEEFGSGSYEDKLSRIMFDYHRSFLTIQYLVETLFSGDVMQVFKEYHKWDEAGRKVTLKEYFQVIDLFR